MEATWDVFISYASQDRAVVRPLAERLKADGLRVWFDEWEVPAGGFIPGKIEDGLARSRALVLCMSEHGCGSDWAKLESWTFRFRDPTNQEGRFIPLHLDDAPVPGTLAIFRHIDWREARREEEYKSLLAACRPPVPAGAGEPSAAKPKSRSVSLGNTDSVLSVAISQDGKRALSGGRDNAIRMWDLESSRCLAILEGHATHINSVAISQDGRRALSGAYDKTVRLWGLDSSRCLAILEGHTDSVSSVAISQDGRRALSGGDDHTVRLWDLESNRCLTILEGHTDSVLSVAISQDGKCALSGGRDNAIRMWDLESSRCLTLLEGHTTHVNSVAISQNGRRALSGADDNTVRLWDLDSGRCLNVLGGHTGSVNSVAISQDGKRALSGAYDKIVRLWDLDSSRCLNVLEGHTGSVNSVAISQDGKHALSGGFDNTVRLWDLDPSRCLNVVEGHTDMVNSVAISQDGKRALSGSRDNTVRLWDLESSRCLMVLEGHTGPVISVAITQDNKRALSGATDHTVRLWDLESTRCLMVLEGHTADVLSVAISQDGKRALSGAHDDIVTVWDLESSRCITILEGHSSVVYSVAISQDGKRALSGGLNSTVRLWDIESNRCLTVLEGHTAAVHSVAISQDGKRALSGSGDNTVRLWDLESSRCLMVLEGHSSAVFSVTISQDGKRALSGAQDNSVRLWDLESSRCLMVLEGHTDIVDSVAISQDGKRLFSAARNGVLRIWDLVPADRAIPVAASEVPYTNAKVLLVGDSGVGKTGLARYLAEGLKDKGEKTSTDGAWATQWSLPHAKQDGVDREIWLWDFAGQVDYRLVHQIFMDDTAAAVLVFNPQNENLFDGLGQWDRDLAKSTRGKLAKLLAAGRVDRGGLVVSNENVKRFMAERGFQGNLHLTSAKTGQGCDELQDAIVGSIAWDRLAVTGSPGLYRRMKAEILRLRDSGLVLLRLAELKQRMELALKDERFDLAQLETVVGLLAGPGMIGRICFGGFVLLRPEVLSRYAAALVRKVRGHPQEMGCIAEEDLLDGKLDYQDFQRLPKDDEAIVLRHLHETLVSRAWCLRQICDGTTTLTFPSYFRRERPELPSYPSVVVTYRFSGPVDDVYATLVVRLHHTTAFETDQLWKAAADFKTQTGQRLGILLIRETEGHCRLDAYFAPDVGEDSRVLFLRYVHDHLREHAQDVVRLRHYGCPNKKCDSYSQPIVDQAKIDKALAPGGKGKVFCPDCGRAIQLRDAVERKFESPEVKEEARKQADQSKTKIDKESRELVLISHALSVANEAGQLFSIRLDNKDGIDGEIEFKDDTGHPTGKKLYLHLREDWWGSPEDELERTPPIRLRNSQWASEWQRLSHPVMLVSRTGRDAFLWMNATEYIRRRSTDGRPPTQIFFSGERLDALAVRRYRDRVLAEP